MYKQIINAFDINLDIHKINIMSLWMRNDHQE